MEGADAPPRARALRAPDGAGLVERHIAFAAATKAPAARDGDGWLGRLAGRQTTPADDEHWRPYVDPL